jgi:hypothetical protein
MKPVNCPCHFEFDALLTTEKNRHNPCLPAMSWLNVMSSEVGVVTARATTDEVKLGHQGCAQPAGNSMANRTITPPVCHCVAPKREAAISRGHDGQRRLSAIVAQRLTFRRV